jgi:quercetin dioxygenase-like cupin family protein
MKFVYPKGGDCVFCRRKEEMPPEPLLPRLTSRVFPPQLPPPSGSKAGWQHSSVFCGRTAHVPLLSCHVSVLSPGHCPHPPHTHEDEEVLLLLQGEADVILPANGAGTGEERRRWKAGQVVYYPAHFAHTLQTVSVHPAKYVVFKWQGGPTRPGPHVAFGQFEWRGPVEDSQLREGFCPRVLFEGPTAYLEKLHCHVSTLTPGAGYDPHCDAYDVAIVVLEGEVETLGQRAGPYSVVFYAAGEPHGMRNSGRATAKYIVFEFHGSPTAAADVIPKSPRSLLAKITDPRCWEGRLKRLLSWG